MSSNAFRALLAVVTISTFLAPRATADELLFVHAIWRHGVRNPVLTVPTDPNQDWPGGYGALTLEGMEQQMELGKLLRKRYMDDVPFLSRQLNNSEIYIRSTDVPRTIRSALANMVGMYSQEAVQNVDFPSASGWPKGYVPVPIHTVPADSDAASLSRAVCRRTDEVTALMQQTPEWKALEEEHRTFLHNATVNAGTNVTLLNIWMVEDSARIEDVQGRSPPAWMKEAHSEIVAVNARITNFTYGLSLAPFRGVDFRQEIPTLLGGMLLWEIIERMKAKADCLSGARTKDCPKEKFYAYSSHDMVLAALFSTLGYQRVDIDRDGLPGFASCFLVELWRRPDGTPYIETHYRRLNEADFQRTTSSISGCQAECTLERFLARRAPKE
ncbi:histidine acid phosphatase [Aphelenchoides avenae]|nr:histidine acid phosphatase [Aphelenchus avenae]